jgi:hypothetical protein
LKWAPAKGGDRLLDLKFADPGNGMPVHVAKDADHLVNLVSP